MIYTLTLHPAIDRVLEVPGFPDSEVMRSELVVMLAAGKGFNVSRNLAILGGESVAAGLVGSPDAAFYSESFGELGVETLLETHPEPTRQNITILAPDAGREVHLRERGPEVPDEVFEALCSRLCSRLQVGDALAVCGSLPAGVGTAGLEALLDAAADAGATTLLDSSGDGLKFSPRSSPRTLKVNAGELGEFLGEEVEGIESAATGAARALELGPDTVLVTLGARGALCATGGGVIHAVTAEVEVRNTVGAGDAFNAGFLWKQAAGLETALRYAVACGAAQAGSPHIGRLDPAAVEELAAGAGLRGV